MRVLVFGAGGVGLGIASALLESGAEVALVGREATVAALDAHGLRLSGLFGERHFGPERFDAGVEPATLGGTPVDFALVCTKSFDTEHAARALMAPGAPIDDTTVFVLCQNGWGNAERFAAHWPAERVYNARVITGFRRPAAFHVEVTAHAQPIAIGHLRHRDTGAVDALCRAIAAGGLPCETSTDVAADLWAKMLYNGCLNPLGALLGVPYGALADDPATRGLMASLAHEIFAVMRAAGFRTHWDDADAWLASFFDEILPPTRAHESSTLQDLRAGRRTEIDALTGVVVSLGAEHGIATPVSDTVLRLVQFAESRASSSAS